MAGIGVVLLAVAGCMVHVHVRVLRHDGRAKVFIGSENCSSTSLNQNRELGLITSSHAVISAIAGTSAAGSRNGTKWS